MADLNRGHARVSPEFLKQVLAKGRQVEFALEGSDELRYLDSRSANANVGGPKLTHILLREEARSIEVWEEFLHGTQSRCGVIDRLGHEDAEIHVKEFMIRHHRLLGLRDDDVALLSTLLKG